MLPLRAQISMGEKFIIPLSGLAAGRNEFFWKAGKEFFESFENTEILDAEFDASVSVERSGRYVGVDCDVHGWLTVECDRCLDDLEMPVDVSVKLSVKFGDEEACEEHQEGEREVIFVPEDNAELDMSQIIYDYVCLSLPMQRYHEDGECNPEALKHLAGGEPVATEDSDMNNPFAALKDMLK